MVKENCIFYWEDHIMNATIRDCTLRNDGNTYPAFPPECKNCKNYRSMADMKKQMLGNYVEVVRCKDCKHRNEYECNKLSHSGTKVGVTDDWFCADGERENR